MESNLFISGAGCTTSCGWAERLVAAVEEMLESLVSVTCSGVGCDSVVGCDSESSDSPNGFRESSYESSLENKAINNSM